jgi:hypothetical protein
VHSQANDSTIEPKKCSTTHERDRWNNLRKEIEIDPEIRKKYTCTSEEKMRYKNRIFLKKTLHALRPIKCEIERWKISTI